MSSIKLIFLCFLILVCFIAYKLGHPDTVWFLIYLFIGLSMKNIDLRKASDTCLSITRHYVDNIYNPPLIVYKYNTETKEYDKIQPKEKTRRKNKMFY